MEKANMHSLDMVNENIKKIGNLFPECVTETVDENGNVKATIDFEKLQENLSHATIGEGEERYQFTWPGKREAIHNANVPTNMTLRPCKEESVDFDNTENLYIEGDNLEVLKLLQENYLGKVKMIYIDPPYNTGNDFVYNDNFTVESSEFRVKSGMFDDDGNMLLQNFEKNTESNGRFHTDWLNMMYPRLKVARNLLSDDGVIFISIDENESHNLRKICDEIYGPSNFLTDFVWSAGRKNDSKHVSVSHEYVLCYFKSMEYIKEHKIIWREKKQGLDDIYATYDKLKKQYCSDYQSIEKGLKAWYKSLPDGHPAKDHQHYSRVDENGIFFADNISWPGGGGPKYNILHPTTGKPVKIPSRGWLTNEKTMHEWIDAGKVEFGSDENGVPTLKSYLKDREFSVPYSVFYKDGRASSKRLATLLGDKVFENPKDEEVLQRIIQFCGTSENDIVLDFFSGSASTAHALFLANVEQQINRKFILVQIPQIIDPEKNNSEKSKKVALNAIKLLDSINAPHNICEIGKERIRRAGDQILELSLQNLEKEGVIEKYARELSEIRSLEEIYGFSGIGLCLGEEVAEGGNIRSVGSNSQGCGVDSVEHGGGAISGEQGVYPVFENSKGITSGTGNTIVDLRTLKILNERGYRIKPEALGRNQQNDIFADKAFDIKGLSSKLSVLNSDRGFRVLKLASSNMKDVYYSPAETTSPDLFDPNNVKEDRTPLDLLFQVMPECNLPLSSKIEERTIEGKTVYFVNGNYLVACFDEGITEKLIKSVIDVPDSEKPYYFYMRNLGLESDKVLDNFEQLFVHYSPSTKRKVI